MLAWHIVSTISVFAIIISAHHTNQNLLCLNHNALVLGVTKSSFCSYQILEHIISGNTTSNLLITT